MQDISVINNIIHADVIDGLKQIPDNYVSLVFTSPPYNCNINYRSHNDNMPWNKYLSWLKEVWKECARVLKPGGRLAINFDLITNRENDDEYVRPLHAELINMMRDVEEMKFRTEIMWLKAKSDPEVSQVVGRPTAWGSYLSCSNPIVMRNHEYILVWSKGQWNLEGDSEQSDMTEEEFLKYTRSTWLVQPETRKPGNHPVPYPVELAKRVIKLFSYRGDVVLDPFVGSGTTAEACVGNYRNFIGIDCDEGYVKYSKSRVDEAMSQRMIEEMSGFRYVTRSERMKKTKDKNKIKKEEETQIF